MKKIIIISCLLITIFLTLIFISREMGTDLEIRFVEELNPIQDTLLMCVEREDGKLVLIDVEIHKHEDIYLYALKLYDHYRNSLPLNYSTPLDGNIEITNIKKINDKVYIELETLYLNGGLNRFLTALMWTYQSLGINSIEIKINDQVFNLKKNDVINLEFASSSIYNTQTQVVIFYTDHEIIPITYCHEEDPIDFLMKKVISKSIYDKVTYEYQIINNNLILDIYDHNYLVSESIIQMILNNLINLGVFENIIILKNDLVVANN